MTADGAETSTAKAGAPAAHGTRSALLLGAIGVVFGDIGTSPLYAVNTVFDIDNGIVGPTHENVYGAVSLIFWSIVIIVSIKYVGLILRADNQGEGGVLSLAHLTRQKVRPGGKRFKLVMVLGVLGAALFYGDSLITPAISVLSAVEGLEQISPGLERFILPVGVTIITVLFLVQRFGTERVGRAFGPIMVVWFVVIAAMGVPHILAEPRVLGALLPHHAVNFFLIHPAVAFVAMGAAVLSITGAEALYADMGHFGRAPIQRGWFFFVFPALTLNYLGQAQLVLSDPAEADNPFFDLAPDWALIPLVGLATIATVIASQAVISGAFSVARQAERLGYLPRFTVLQTSAKSGGQIYVPAVNWLLFVGVLLLLVTFERSERLASAYGLAVTATLLLTTTLFVVYADAALGWGKVRIAAVIVGFGVIELLFFGANVLKFTHGGWLSVLVAGIVGTAMFTWRRGRTLVRERRREREGSLLVLLEEFRSLPVPRVPGTAVFLHQTKRTAPLALRESYRVMGVVHENILIVQVVSTDIPYVDEADRLILDDLEDPLDNVWHATMRVGYLDEIDVPRAVAQIPARGLPLDIDNAFYFVSRMVIVPGNEPGMARWRKHLFVAMAQNSTNPSAYYHLPVARTVVMGARIPL